VAQRVGRDIALLFHTHGTIRWCVASRTPRPPFTPGKDPVPILQEVGWAPGPVWTGGKSRPHRYSIPDRPPLSHPLSRPRYPAPPHTHTHTHTHIYIYIHTYIFVKNMHVQYNICICVCIYIYIYMYKWESYLIIMIL
jgi:hypothetical protein